MKPSTREIIRRQVRAEMVRRGLGGAELGKALHRSPGTIHNVVAGFAKSAPVRILIEDYFQMPFWSTAKEFQTRTTTKRK